MFTYETTRAKAAFDSFTSSYSSSSLNNAVTGGIGYVQSGLRTFSEIYNAGGGSTYQERVEGAAGGFTAGTGFSEANALGGTSYTSINVSGSTWSVNRTAGTTNSSTVSNRTTTDGGTLSFPTTSEIGLISTETNSYERQLITSSTFTVTEVPFYATSTRTFTSTDISRMVSDTEYEFTYDEYFYATTTETVTNNVYTNITVNGPYELGTVVEGNDYRLYSFNDSQTWDFPSGGSFTKQTFFADTTDRTVEFFTYTQAPTVSYNNPAETYNGSIASFGAGVTMSVPVVTGWNIPHGTSTAFGISYAPTNYTFSGGIGSNSGTAITTYETTLEGAKNTTTAATILASLGIDRSTFTIGTATTQATSYSRTNSLSPSDPFRSHYQASSTFYSAAAGTGTASNINATNASGFVQAKGATKTLQLHTHLTVTNGSGVDVFQPVPMVGGRKQPRSMSQADGTGTNLSILPSIFYPWYSSVQSNVVVPVKRNGSAVTGSTTWKYKWDSFTLNYTTQNSLTSGSGSGQIVQQGAHSTHAWRQVLAFPAVAGGIPPVSASSALLVMKPGGHGITTYNSAGVSGTSKTILSAFSTANVGGSAQVISGLPIVSVSTGEGGGSTPWAAFTRNG